MSPSASVRHQRISSRLNVAFANHVAANGGGEVLYAPMDVVLSTTDVVQPDLLLVADDQREIITEKNIQGTPAFAIEIVSDARMDRVRKRDLYERFDRRSSTRAPRPHTPSRSRPEIIEPGEPLT